MSGYSVPSTAGDSLVRHGELVGGRRHVQDHGLPQVMMIMMIMMVMMMTIILIVFHRILGFYASAFILIVISLDRSVQKT